MKNPPKLKQKLEVKKYHGIEIKDEYSWIHQKNILEVLRDSSKLNPEVRKYLEEENAYTKFKMQDTEQVQKKLFKEIKGRIKLDDESLHFFYNKDEIIIKLLTPLAIFFVFCRANQDNNKNVMTKIIIPVITIFI